jgi:hypothetical protein
MTYLLKKKMSPQPRATDEFLSVSMVMFSSDIDMGSIQAERGWDCRLIS